MDLGVQGGREMGKEKSKLRIRIEPSGGFLLGANININKWDGLEAYLVIYLVKFNLIIGYFKGD